MRQALRNAIRLVEIDDVTMFFGPDRNGALLEVGVLDLDSDDPVILHAMRLRPRFYPYL
jgi:hypothetical protein